MKYCITIPKPCNEDWSEMTPTQRGAFCQNCQKEVFDFTHKSKFQLVVLFNKDSKLCGRFSPQQLNDDISSVKNKRASRIGLWLGLSSFLSITSPVLGQNERPEIPVSEISSNSIQNTESTQTVSDSILIKGRVIHDDYPLPGVVLHLKGTSRGAQSDHHGNFSFSIENEIIEEYPILSISYVGFKAQELRVKDNIGFLNIEMFPSEDVLGMVVIRKQNIFQRIGNLFRKKHKENCGVE